MWAGPRWQGRRTCVLHARGRGVELRDAPPWRARKELPRDACSERGTGRHAGTEEFACRVALAGGVGVHFDQTHRGRLRARFSVQHGGQSLRLSAISPDPRASPLRKSALRDSIDAQGYRRSPEFLRTLKDRLISEIDHAADRRAAKHGVDQVRLQALRAKIAEARMPSVPLEQVRDETGFGFPRFVVPDVVDYLAPTPSAAGLAKE